MKVLDKDGLTYYTGKVKSTLTDYVKFTDYATAQQYGVIKAGYHNFNISEGRPYATTSSYANYETAGNGSFIGKGTLENVITGKGLVSNTDYASESVAGVIKTGAYYGTNIASSGKLIGAVKTYAQYTSSDYSSDFTFICKGTLENVLTERIGNIQTLLDNLNNGGGVE